MRRKVVLDNEIQDITETRVWRVLDEFNEFGGNGLTANALCYLTKQPWKVVRSVLTERTGPRQISGMYCGDVQAPVFFNWYGMDQQFNILMAHARHLITKSDKIIHRYPPPKYQGATEEKGQKTLTFHMFEGSYDDDDDYDNCGDPSCCPPRAKDAKDRRKQNVKLAKDLMAVWK